MFYLRGRIYSDYPHPCQTCPCSGINVIKENNTKHHSYLYQNQPNPFSKSTEIKFFISDDAKHPFLFIYDMQGILIKRIPIYGRDVSSITIDAHELQAGTYLYQLMIDGEAIDCKKMVLTK
jgi:hypothetical protein